MTKEMPIIFVYDTLRCQSEHDDPSEAVLYFHPSWVSDQQRLALCGQLMGTTYFLKSVFTCPKIIELKSGKFVIKTFGRYILAVGTDRNIANWMLQYRAEILSSLFSFYHCDMQLINQPTHTTKDLTDETITRNKIADKLYQIFETYLPILQYGSNIFQSVPTIRLPKSSSNVFLEAVQTLEFCQQSCNVLGGMVLYHNKVVATQLSSDITKHLVLTDPHHIKCPAEIVPVQFHLPADTQILVVYIEQQEYNRLQKDSSNAKSLSHNKQLIFNKTSISRGSKDTSTKTTLKRDKSIIFTTVPEEDVDQSNSTKSCNINSEAFTKDIIKPKSIQKFKRPTHLPLKFKNVTSRDLPESDLSKTKIVDEEAIPEFKGQTSVCSTPMTDLNKILHGRAMSICGDNDKKEIADSLIAQNDVFVNDIIQLKELREGFLNVTKYKRRNSLPDLRTGKVLNKGFSMRPYGFGLSKFNYTSDDEDKSPSFDNKRHRTLSEPCCPILSSAETEDFYELKLDYATKPEPLIDKLCPASPTMKTPPVLDIKQRISLDRSKMTLPLCHSTNTPVSTIPLTPLMTKLSILSTLQDTAGDIGTPEMLEKHPACETPMTPISNNIFSKVSEVFAGKKRAHLLVCGQRNMTLLLMLEDGAGLNEQLVLDMWETCVGRLPRLESRLRDSLGAVEPDQIGHSDSDHSYSFMCLDPQWDIVNRGGPWTPPEMIALGHMHNDMNLAKDRIEVVLRSDETILYGYQCGQTEIYYQQSAEKRAGIPPPADLMGSVQIRARRRLERDHAIVLL